MVKYLAQGENLTDILGNELYLVDFYADWCGPCKMLGPILEEIDLIPILKINVDEHPDIAQKFGIMSIPTLMIFKDGKEQKKLIGLHSKTEIIALINEFKSSN